MASRTDVLTRDQIRAYAAGALPHATGAQLDIAVAIALAESGGKVGAVSTTNDHGIWQINARWHPTYNVARLQTDPAYNAQAMAAISSNANNWGPWTTYKTGAYKKHLVAGATTTQGIAGGITPDLVVDFGGHVIDAINPGDDILDSVTGIASQWVDPLVAKSSKAMLAIVFTVAGLALVMLGVSRLTKQSPTLQSASSALGAAGTVAALI